jgi:uncharacterized protein YndB with AHSA1/START domain
MTTEQMPGEAVVLTTPTDVEIRAERMFDAPRERVFAAFTDPELIPQWWGPGTVVEEMDVREGGSWRFVNGDTVFHGTYEEVTPPERLVWTFAFEGMGKPHLETATFEDLGDRTKFTTTLVFDTTEERDQLLSYGGESGMNQSYARLDALLARLASG